MTGRLNRAVLGAGTLALLILLQPAPGVAQSGLLGPPTVADTPGSGELAGLPQARSQAVSTNGLVNDRAGQICNGNGCTQSETTIATKGGSIFYAGWNDSEGFFNPAAGVSGFGVSIDGGTTWSDGGGLPQGGGLVSGDPSLAVCDNPDQVFMANLFFPAGAANADLSVHTGTRVGTTVNWGPPVNVTQTPSRFEDKEYLVCDRLTNNLYLSYTNFGFNGQIEFRRSTDGNLTWSAPVVLQPEELFVVNQGSYPAVGPNGEVCVAWVRRWLTHSTPQIQVRCSIDQGRRSARR